MMFFVNGALYANWVVRIPDIQSNLGLSPGELGLALLGVPIGTLLTMPITGWLVTRNGSRTITLIGGLLMSLALPLPALAPSLITLTVALALLGAGGGMQDVAMNAQAVVVERRYQRPIMSSFHALFSFGGIAGAVAGGFIAAAGLTPPLHLLAAAIVLAVVAIVAWRRLLPGSADIVHEGPMLARPNRALLGLAAIAFCVVLSEGAMADWSAVYLRHSIGSGPGVAAAGYAAFAVAMTAGRIFGDRLSQSFQRSHLVRTGALVAASGLIVAIAIPETAAVLAGFAGVGAGLSFIFPIVLSVAARTPGLAPSVAIAALTTTSYFGFLVGPPVIGFAAELTSLRISLGLIAVLSLTVVLLSSTVDRTDDLDTGDRHSEAETLRRDHGTDTDSGEAGRPFLDHPVLTKNHDRVE